MGVTAGERNTGTMRLREIFGFLAALLLALSFGAARPAAAQQQAPVWTARFNGPLNSFDGGSAITVDSSGNVYVAGSTDGGYWGDGGTGGDYETVKYDAAGNKLWNRQEAWSGDGGAAAIAVDGSGNVYVTGATFRPDLQRDDFATLKYDANGNLLWLRYYNGGLAHAIAVDGSGNVYVSGENGGEYRTLKYDTNGTLLWERRYAGDRGATAMVLDGSGNVYVTGSPGGDYGTVKYDNNGNLLWARRFDGPFHGDDRAHAIAVDGSGNVYVTGYAIMGDNGGIGGLNADYATVKYDLNGNQLWVAYYNGPVTRWDEALEVAVDSSGNVYVNGVSTTSFTIQYWDPSDPTTAFEESQYDMVTVKYDATGTQQWVRRQPGGVITPGGSYWQVAVAMAVDKPGNVYVTGETWRGDPQQGGSDWDYGTVSYDPTGAQRWVGYYNGTGNSTDQPSAMVVDALGNAYVTGASQNSLAAFFSTWDFGTVKYGGVAATATTPSGGGSVTISTAPTTSGSAGAMTTFTNPAGSPPATVTVQNLSSNPEATGVVDVGGGYVDIHVAGASASATLTSNFYYASTVTGTAEANLKLYYFNGTDWVEVRSSGNTDPVKNTTDNLDGTVSGGRFTATFDNTSTPRITELTGTVFIYPPVIPVTIDIQPGTTPNSINLGSGGTVPVAILSTATFDARKVDPVTVTLASAPVKLKGNGTAQASVQDVNGDGRPDLVVHVTTQALQLSQTDTIAVLNGRLLDKSAYITGKDTIRVVP